MPDQRRKRLAGHGNRLPGGLTFGIVAQDAVDDRIDAHVERGVLVRRTEKRLVGRLGDDDGIGLPPGLKMPSRAHKQRRAAVDRGGQHPFRPGLGVGNGEFYAGRGKDDIAGCVR